MVIRVRCLKCHYGAVCEEGEKLKFCPDCREFRWLNYYEHVDLTDKNEKEEDMTKKKVVSKEKVEVKEEQKETKTKEKKLSKVFRISELAKLKKTDSEIANTIREEFGGSCSPSYVKASLKYLENKK